MADDIEIYHHYDKIALYTYADETAWEFCSTMGCHLAGTTEPSPEDWLKVIGIADEGLEKYYDHEDLEEVRILLRHVARAERGFLLKRPVPGMTDTELTGALAAGETGEEEVMDALGSAFEPDVNLDYFLLLTDGVSAEDKDKALRRAKTCARLAKYYFGEDAIYNDILAAYGTCLIYLGNVKKATAMFDTIFEGDEMNLRSMVAVCDALEKTEHSELYKKYMREAINTAMALENEEIAAGLIDIFTSVFPDENAEDFFPDVQTMTEIMEMRSPDVQKTIWNNVQEMHPRDMERLIEEEGTAEELDRLFEHITCHVRICSMIAAKTEPVYSDYLELAKTEASEHKRLHTLIEKYRDRLK
ncbi:MAG: hypothetical protein IK083_05115 [Abditibacteriota bacterium]|nr:hypothetical protein [Abditibacteriota bacterium]